MSELILFAGTFDPFHRGHRAILESALAALPGARALVAPARIPRWRAAPSLPYERRLEIARRSIAGLAAEVIEESDAVDRTAIDVVRAVRRRTDGERLYYLVGADAARSVPAWEGLDALLAEATLMIAPRPGFELSVEELCAREPSLRGQLLLLAPSGSDASATLVRSGRRDLLVEGVEDLV